MRVAIWLLVLITFTAVPAASQTLSAGTEQPVSAGAESGQPAAQPVAEAASPAPLPEIRADTSIFRRQPEIDGRIDPGEWDTFYTIGTSELKATTYADWTSQALYFAVRADRAVDMTIVIDGANDGWFHGSDNYQVKCMRQDGGAPTLEVRRYDSRSTKKPEPQPIPSDLTSPATMKVTPAEGDYVAEVCLPGELLPGLSLRNGARVGLRLSLRTGMDESAWIPQTTLGDVEECTLVHKKSAALDPLQMNLEMRDERVVPGEEVQARLYLKNGGTEPIDATAFVIGGEGKAAQYLNSEMVRLEGLQPGKSIRHTFRSRVPSGMPPGCWALGAELKSGNNRIGGAITSFEVANPYDVIIEPGTEPFRAGSGWRKVFVKVRNNSSEPAYGRMTISLPEGWRVSKSIYTRRFYIEMEDGMEEVRYEVSVPPEAKPGPARISIDAEINKIPIRVSREVVVE